ncbi:MAG: ATP-binding protein [Bacteroidota bacterium]
MLLKRKHKNYLKEIKQAKQELAETKKQLAILERKSVNNTRKYENLFDEERLRSLFQYSSDSVTVINKEFKIIFESSLKGKISGFEIEELLGESIYKLIHKEDQIKFRNGLEDVIQDPGKTVKLEIRGIKKNGNVAYIECIIANHIETKLIEGIVISSRDISSRKNAELREKKHLELQSFLSHSALSFLKISDSEEIFNYIGSVLEKIVKGLPVTVTAFNPLEEVLVLKYYSGFEKFKSKIISILGLNPENIKIKVTPDIKSSIENNSRQLYNFENGLHEVVNGHFPKFICQAIEKLLDIKEIYGMSFIYKGTIFGTAIIYVQGKNNLDILQKKTIETFLYQASIAFHRKHLEDELIIARDKAEDSDRLKTAFLANMSHEIRTPMNGIIGFAQLLSEEDLFPGQIKEYARSILDNGHLLINLINDIIDLSQIETGHVKIEKKEFGVNALIDDVYNKFKSYQSVDRKKDIAFDIVKSIPDDQDLVISDPARIKQILSNLLGNAFKFTSKGSITFGVHQKNETLEFFVKDTGIGISPGQHDTIFERFVQADISATRKYGGSGLGLAISKGFAELLGGKIWFESEPGKGSTFYFTIPSLTKSHITKTDNDKKTAVFPGQENVNWSGYTFLVVEDDLLSSKYLELLLKKNNANVLLANNGKKAIDFFTGENTLKIDLVLMDIQLPEISGYDATRLIRKYNHSVPIIAQTAHAMTNDEKKCMEAGCNAYISKPINPTKLVSEIEKLLHASH